MDQREFKQAREFAQLYGAKAIVHGAPGSGKTPITNTAPRPLLVVVEPGMLSMRKSTIPAVECYTPERCDDFFKWLFGSREAANYDTIAIDSVSQMAEIYLKRALKKNKDGRAAYGVMSTECMEHLNGLFFMRQKHTYLICKQMIGDDGIARPFFPGKDMNTKVPHLYDVILSLAFHSIPGVGNHKSFRTAGSFDAVARDRSGNLAEFEPTDLTALFAKVMS